MRIKSCASSSRGAETAYAEDETKKKKCEKANGDKKSDKETKKASKWNISHCKARHSTFACDTRSLRCCKKESS